jgi:hypothetical protein
VAPASPDGARLAIGRQFSEHAPAARHALTPATAALLKSIAALLEAPSALAAMPAAEARSASPEGEPQDEGVRHSLRDQFVPTPARRMVPAEAAGFVRLTEAADAMAPVRDAARLAALPSLLANAPKLSGPKAETLWTPVMPAAAVATVVRATGAAAAAALPEQDLADVAAKTLDQIVQSIKLAWSRGEGEAHIRLDPRQFGDVTVALKVEGGRVTVRLEADVPAVREWLRTNQSALSAALVDRELHLDQLEVSPPRDDSGSESREQAQPRQHGQQAPRRDRRGQPGHIFEVVE